MGFRHKKRRHRHEPSNQDWSDRFMNKNVLSAIRLGTSVMLVLWLSASVAPLANAQDYDDPPARVARLGYMQGSVSFQPAGEDEWVQAGSNRPMTTGDKLWADRDARAEVQLGSSMINLAPNTGFSFLNLDDRTVQAEITAGAINLRVWSLNRDNVYEIDTPNQAFTISEPGRYRIETGENGDYTAVTIWEGAGESTGNGQSYTLRAGQRVRFSGTTSLNAEVEQIASPDDFDRWSESRWHRYDNSASARYCSRDVVGFEDLDDYGDWRPSPEYGTVWYPRVGPGWAPYHSGHWAWIDPWGWTWVDDENWGYAPFHYGRWASFGGRWGWVPGPREVYPVYAPALVVFLGGGLAVGSNVGWFPLGPREVYVPSYRVSPTYVNRVNVTNTTVNQTTITNVYNTTIVNKNTTINNVNYVNRNVQGAVTAVPRQAFASAQPVARTAVRVNPNEFARTPVSMRAAVQPERQAVLGVHANTAGRVAAPPRAVAQRPVVARNAPPPLAPAFSARQQVLARQPGVPIPRKELQRMAPARPESQRNVRVAPPAKPATPTPAVNRGIPQPGNRPGAPAANERPGATPAAQPRPGQPAPNNQPAPNSRPQPGQPTPNNRPDMNQPNRPAPGQAAPNNRPDMNQPNRPSEPPARNDRPPSAQPNRPAPGQSPNSRPEMNPPNRPQPAPSTPDTNRPQQNRPLEPPARNDRAPAAEPNRPQQASPPQNNRPDNRPDMSRREPSPPPANERPENQPNRMEPNRPPQTPPGNDRFPSAQPSPRPQPGQPAPGTRPEVSRPEQQEPPAGRPDRPQNRPEPQAAPSRPEPGRQAEPPRNQPAPRQQNAPNDRPPDRREPDGRPPQGERFRQPDRNKHLEDLRSSGERFA
jgi:hypothetical protein